MSTNPVNIAGRIISVAQAEVLPGKETEVVKHLEAIRAAALSEAEPGCYTYRVMRYGTRFLVFEEYENLEALK
ncbi:hypothetical protein SISSUDRAFT_1119570 [Sistotremastrum suecicum HHB10207 ss-3]|uniref:ABM domain-containing protein n=1 Tax=Sistotremastrum suecicum HHB10207 ss-3 TaxID=1314776 RepID=A0A166DIP6_9AGAM|nr:hypothetical protein SISSUDRAFT_1119570 [Sistotremastrum suecicum HHB10207 ss-3]